jgi:hypothetical protein
MTLEELEEYVLGLTLSGGAISELEKELAVLRGRVDGLEAKVEELEIMPSRLQRSAVLVIDEYDIETGDIKKTAKTLKFTGNYEMFRRLSTDSKAIFVARGAIVFSEDNTTGIWPTINVVETGDLSVTGNDYVMGVPAFNGDTYYNSGILPTNRGGFLIVNKQDVN